MSETQIALAQTGPTLPLSMDASKSRAVPVILLVEDEKLVREATANILEFGGYRVLRTRNAYEAKTAFHRYGEIVHLLITDVVLPGQNGLDLARELRSNNQDLRVLFISGFPENNWTREHREGEALYLEKPFSAESLMHEVRRALFDVEEVAI